MKVFEKNQSSQPWRLQETGTCPIVPPTCFPPNGLNLPVPSWCLWSECRPPATQATTLSQHHCPFPSENPLTVERSGERNMCGKGESAKSKDKS